MAAPGHPRRGSSTARTYGRGKNSLSLDAHYIDRPDVKASYIDTHCHLFTTLQMMQEKLSDSTIPKNRVDLLVKKLFPPNVKAVVDIHCDLPMDDYHKLKQLSTEWPEDFAYYFAVGAHPHTAPLYSDQTHQKFVEIMSDPRCVAWGECGLDYFKNPPGTFPTQREVFTRQILAAVSLNKPIVIHTREADDDTKEILDKHMPRDHTFHVHCFTSSTEFGKWVLATFPNSYIGITGVVSYNLPHVAEFIRSGELPLERMLMETDSPFMIPKNIYPWMKTRSSNDRRKRFEISHSGMIPFTAELVAGMINEGREAASDDRRTNVEEVLDVTRKNAEKVYRISI
ncbi:Metallo-dependent hydrolase [Wilcoxina mikolae CBS 423.85]|nr:Metallo-dependent hydrolase [Wilcoxina mikolae CBS 423.85]